MSNSIFSVCAQESVRSAAARSRQTVIAKLRGTTAPNSPAAVPMTQQQQQPQQPQQQRSRASTSVPSSPKSGHKQQHGDSDAQHKTGFVDVSLARETSKIQNVFDKLDVNHDGLIDRPEFESGVRKGLLRVKSPKSRASSPHIARQPVAAATGTHSMRQRLLAAGRASKNTTSFTPQRSPSTGSETGGADIGSKERFWAGIKRQSTSPKHSSPDVTKAPSVDSAFNHRMQVQAARKHLHGVFRLVINRMCCRCSATKCQQRLLVLRRAAVNLEAVQ